MGKDGGIINSNRVRSMGQSPFPQKQKLQSPNDHFLALTISPDNNKMFAQIFVASSMALNRWASDLIKLAQSQPQNILIPKQYKVIEESTCGEGVTLEIEFECYYIPLSNQINKRCDCQKYLEETEMWYLLFGLSESAVACERIGQRIGNVNPQNILLNKSGKFKIISKLSVPNYYDPIIDSNKRNAYLSPQELEIVKKSFKDYTVDYILSESFSIGMSLLSAGTLEDLSRCYDYKKAELIKIQFNKIISFWQQNQFYSEFQKKKTHYSQKLKSLVCSLLQINPSKRITSIEIYNMLLPHKEAIMKMEPFDMELRKLSPRKLEPYSNGQKKEVIHQLRSKKKNEFRLSPQKKQQSKKVEEKLVERLEFSFGSPATNLSSINKSIQEMSPAQKLKLANSYNFVRNLQDSK